MIHIINQELLQHGTNAITKLLPDDVVCYWELEEEEPLLWNPVTTFPF